jgi:hypothetical protein
MSQASGRGGYGSEHQRVRAQVIAAGSWIGAPCPRCGKPMTADQAVDLDHLTDAGGHRLGGYVPGFLSHSRCNRSAGGSYSIGLVNARRRANQTPERRERDLIRQAKRDRRANRAEFDAVQAMIRADEAGNTVEPTDAPDTGRPW